ncbi:MAG: hypothetical protein J1F18_08160 [Lachnospiraceae bacterium]|nr:hypothetical protein [Lachnospiraceae bacterium]
MKYFLIETDEKNRIPYSINKSRTIDIRLLTKEDFGKLPRWNIAEMDIPQEVFFPDILCNPFLLLSEACIKTVMMYQPDIFYTGIKLWNKGSGLNRTYFLLVLDELECMSDETQYNSVRNRIIRLVLDRGKIGQKAIFQIKGFDGKGFVGRLDFVESILRRGARGIKLTEIEISSAK